VVVDGAPRPGTVLTLSHWPGTPTPEELWADTSAEIVLHALGRRRLWPRGVETATIDHYDADGLISLGLLVVDGLAETHGALLVDAARAGDFDVVAHDDAARVAFSLAALRADSTASATERALATLADLASRPRAFETLWGPEEGAYRAACAMRADGALRIEDRPALDLAVVHVDADDPRAEAAAWDGAVVHRAAVHSATSCLRTATVTGRRYEVLFRYETWVRLGRRRPRRRVDLAPLAARLQELELDGGAWEFDGAGAIVPRLRRTDEGESTLAPAQFLEELESALRALDQGPPAWDPYARPVAVASAG
jgi:hypothetical protein